MVTVKVSGDLVVKSVTIASEAIDPEDPELLQDMVTAAANEANPENIRRRVIGPEENIAIGIALSGR